MSRKTFVFGDPNTGTPEQHEPIGFDLVGKDRQGKDVGPFPFDCVPEMPENALVKVFAAAERKHQMLAMEEAIDFIRRTLSPVDQMRFDSLLDHPNINFGSRTLGDVFQYLVEEYSKRPTQASSVSSVGPMPTGITSMDAASGTAAPAPSV